MTFLLLLLLLPTEAWLTPQRPQYGILANHGAPVGNFFLVSERASGSNFVESLLGYNLLDISYVGPEHRHFGRGGPYEANVLVIVLVRDPYDWLRSTWKNPWHSEMARLKDIDRARYPNFSDFLRVPWKLDRHSEVVMSLEDRRLHEFPNVLEMRNSQMAKFWNIQRASNNSYYLQYEVVRNHPLEVLLEICSIFEIACPEPSKYRPVIHYKGDHRQGHFRQVPYEPINSQDMALINNSLDWRMERNFDYRPRR